MVLFFVLGHTDTFLFSSNCFFQIINKVAFDYICKRHLKEESKRHGFIYKLQESNAIIVTEVFLKIQLTYTRFVSLDFCKD